MAENAAAPAPPAFPGSAQTRLVLVVDDEPGVRELVGRTLRSRGYRTLEASDGSEALDLVEAGVENIDLIVTDVVMPGMDGRELGRRLAQSRPTLPILYISAYDVNDIFRRGSPRHSAPFLQKPFPPTDLINSVEQLLQSHSHTQA
jgi:two-component system, cell cycle sensor histidine kinase and response regulator CckA